MNRSTGRQDVLCIVAPFYNEEAMVDLFYETLRDELLLLEDIDYRLVLVDDGSSDDTLARLNAIADHDEAVQVISLSRNFGHQIALTAGLDHAQGDAVLTMDSDLQHPPSLIAPMVALWRQGHDVVSAVRRQTEQAGWFKRHSADAFYWLVNRLSDTPIERGACDFCLLSEPAHQALRSLPERHRFLRGMVAWIGFRRVFIPFSAPARVAGESKYTLPKMMRLAMDAVFSFSATPIRMASRVGTLVMLAAVAYLCYVLGRFWVLGDLIPGWSSLICTVLILGGLQLLFIGIVGEYVSRVFEEAKQRPLYLLKPPRAQTETSEPTTVAERFLPAGLPDRQPCPVALKPTSGETP